ncbi:MAG: lipopolysaccharide kinase InaA family protein [Pseudomonadales bacterium]
MTRDFSELVKAPQQRRGHGFSVVYRVPGWRWGASSSEVFVKTQRDYTCRPAWRLWRRTPTLRRELRALNACAAFGLPVPRVICYREDDGVAELVVEGIPDTLPLDEALARPGANRQRIVANVARTLALLHRHGWVHGALGNAHVLIQTLADDRVALIDFEKARRRRALIGRDLDRFWRRTGCMSGDEKDQFLRIYREAAQHDRRG